MKTSHGFILGVVVGFGACYLWGQYKKRQAA